MTTALASRIGTRTAAPTWAPHRTLVRRTALALPHPGPGAVRYALAAECAARAAARLAAMEGAAPDVGPGPRAAARRRLDAALAELTARRAEALDDARRALACGAGDEAVLQAAVATSEHLYRALVRCGELAGLPDRRTVRSEPALLRHVLRAATKTVPLGWFADVGWGDPGGTGGGTTRGHAVPSLPGLARVVAAVRDGLPAGRRPLRPAADLCFAGDRAHVARPDGDGRELVDLPASPVLRAAVDLADAHGPVTAADLGRRLAAALPLSPGEAARAVGRLVEAGVLVPDPQIDPNDPAPAAAAASWVRGAGAPDVAAALDRVDRLTSRYAVSGPEDRLTVRAELDAVWEALPGDAGPPRLTEDVVTPGVAPADVDTADLVALQPVLELFDRFTVVRRAQRARFVRAHGTGATCQSLTAYAAEYARLWDDPALLADPDVRTDPVLRAVLDARARACDLVALSPGPGGVLDALLTPALLADAAAVRATRRPVSYGLAVQDAGTLHVVNEVSGGWGRSISRFLDHLWPAATVRVAADVVAALGPDGVPVQVRAVLPGDGFAANRHPRVLPEEFALVAGQEGIRVRDLHVVHDVDGDEVRLRHAPTGRLLDAVHLGCLVPPSLPRHLLPVVNDLGSGLVDLSGLVPAVELASPLGPVRATGRLRLRTAVLRRRTWLLTGRQTAELSRSLLDGGAAGPEPAVARLRGALALPRHVFVGAHGGHRASDLPGGGTFLDRMGSPRSQYVDLADPLHVRHLGRLLGRHPDGVRIEEALPAPTPGVRTVEHVVETYRGGAR